MKTLRRSKSLNEKISRQKNRSADVVRDHRSPDVAEGRTRTRTCLDNYQLLVHLRKQADDRSRQLDLAYTYGTNTHTFLRHAGTQGGPEHPCSPRTTAASALAGTSCKPDLSDVQIPASGVHHRQRSMDDRACRRSVRRQASFSEGQLLQITQDRSSLQPKRPMSMFEPRAFGQFPTAEEWTRKDQVIQNLRHNQKNANVHSEKLLSKIDELEFENTRLRAILNAHSIPYGTLPPGSKLRSPRGVPVPHDVRIPCSDVYPKHTSTLISPISETSVSGYGSLAGSAYGEGYIPASEVMGGVEGIIIPERVEVERVAGVGDYDDHTLPLSEVSGERVESRDNTLPTSSSSGGDSRMPTLNRESDIDSLHGKMDQLLELEKHRGSARKKRIADLEQQVMELKEQRNAVLERYKHSVDENERLTRRDEHVQEELRGLLQQHGQNLEQVIRSELQGIQEELKGLGQDVRGQVETMLVALTSMTSPVGTPRSREPVVMDPDVRDVMDKVVDLIGPEYVNLGRRLNVPQLELERIENGREDFAHKTRQVLRSWLRHRRKDADPAEGITKASASASFQILTQALRDIDKDIRLFNNPPISKPERQALRNCLQFAIDHVLHPEDVLDHVIALNELTPAGIAFVKEMMEQGERALCRLWHVCEYRGSGIISRLALALERSGHPHISHRLTDELEIQNSRVRSHYYHPLSEELDRPAASTAAHALGSRLAPSSPSQRSRPTPGSAKAKLETFEAFVLPCRLPAESEKSVPLPLPAEREVVWDRRPIMGTRSVAATRHISLEKGTKISMV